MASSAQGPQTPGERAARGRRDDSLRRVRSLTKGIAVATAAAVGVLGFYVAKAFPGHSATPATQSSSTTTPTPATTPATTPSTGQSGSASSSPTVTAPPSPPVTTPRPAQVNTGAS